MEELIKSLIGLLGVVLGVSITHFFNKNIKQIELSNQLKIHFLQEKRDVYSKFLAELNTAATLAISDKSQPVEKINKAQYLLAQIELYGNKDVYEQGKQLMDILLQYFTKGNENKFPSLVEPRKKFVELAKADLDDAIKNS